ncbi:methylated-DNA--protein-cysteine methyltransferase [Actinorhabdospora filicis]|uniref:Methylated-DNA--protein-cysteine methyltransferase n=1 Tax=Actinorhabdospora filicis TaxID=1785913 RepID=A0A9W6WDR9_9ACTN|nr:methylated-DNA--[protein]-cysteine S-methyltransferase [Actinorhabdospora filicis]GLZ81125.1 methylated-DNA--protein-cysteine methyltransferase [Actinorhabdospora filicis]
MRWTTVTSPIGELRLATDGTALTNVSTMPGNPVRGERSDDDPILRLAAAELAGYFAGTRTEFEVPLALAGSDFERAVWTEVLAIPYGATATHAEIAARVGQPKAARAVGLANSLNPIAIIVPGHRVVGSFPGRSTGTDVTELLLELEARAGVVTEFKAA